MTHSDIKGFGCLAIVASIVSVLFSCVALLRWDNWKCEINPYGFVISVFAILVTFLVAWQIWQTMLNNEQLNEIHSAISEVDRLREETEMLRELPTGIRLNMLGRNEQAQDNTASYRLAIHYYAMSLNSLVAGKADYNMLIRDSLEGISTCIDNLNNSGVYKDYANEIYGYIIHAEQQILKMEENLDNAKEMISKVKSKHNNIVNAN